MPAPTAQFLSRTVYTTDGVTTFWDFSFTGGYLDGSHVKAYTVTADGIRTELAGVTLVGPYQIKVSPALAAGATLVIYRDTPKDLPLVDFTDESGFSEISLDTNAKQAVFIAAETLDAIDFTPDIAASASATAAASSALAAAGSALAAELSAASINTANLVNTSTNQTVSGTKTFSNPIQGSVTGSAGTAGTPFAQTLLTATTSAQARATMGISAASGSADVGYTPAGVGAVATTVQAKLRESVSVKDFGAVGDGIANDRAAILAAFAANKRVFFPSGTYWLGSYSTEERIIDLSSLGEGVTIIADKSVEFVCHTTTTAIPIFFYLKNNSHFTSGPVKFRDTGYDSSVTWKGAVGFYLACDTSSNWGDVTIDAVYGRNLVSVVIVGGGDATHRIRGINIGQLFSDDCCYGFNAQNQGDGVHIGNLIAYQNYRPYYVFGVSGHKVNIFNRNNRGGTGAVNISRSPGGLNTTAIDVTYTARDMAVGIAHVLINHIDLLGGTISDVKVHVDIESSVIYSPVRFVNYTGSGGSETSAASTNVVADVFLSGSCDGQADPVDAVAAYGTKGILRLAAGRNFFTSASVLALFYSDLASRGASVTWTASSVNPSLGNGTLANNYDLSAGVIHNNVSLTIGSTTTLGTGAYTFGLTYTSRSEAIGPAWILDDGAVYYIGVARITAGSNLVQIYVHNVGPTVGQASPMIWATGDKLTFSIAYPIA